MAASRHRLHPHRLGLRTEGVGRDRGMGKPWRAQARMCRRRLLGAENVKLLCGNGLPFRPALRRPALRLSRPAACAATAFDDATTSDSYTWPGCTPGPRPQDNARLLVRIRGANEDSKGVLDAPRCTKTWATRVEAPNQEPSLDQTARENRVEPGVSSPCATVHGCPPARAGELPPRRRGP